MKNRRFWTQVFKMYSMFSNCFLSPSGVAMSSSLLIWQVLLAPPMILVCDEGCFIQFWFPFKIFIEKYCKVKFKNVVLPFLVIRLNSVHIFKMAFYQSNIFLLLIENVNFIFWSISKKKEISKVNNFVLNLLTN